MEPDAATIQNRNTLECLVWGGFLVAASDGRIDRAEFDALAKAVKSKLANEAATAIQQAAEPLKLIRESFHKAAQGCRSLTVPQRHAIIQQLIAVANANVAVAAEEKHALQEICIALQLNPSFPEKILAQYTDCVFAHMN
jgi:tellurite resistance protein